MVIGDQYGLPLLRSKGPVKGPFHLVNNDRSPFYKQGLALMQVAGLRGFEFRPIFLMRIREITDTHRQPVTCTDAEKRELARRREAYRSVPL